MNHTKNSIVFWHGTISRRNRQISISSPWLPVIIIVSLSECYLLAMLTNGTRFMRDAHFEQLSPLYQVTAEEIELYIKSCLTATL